MQSFGGSATALKPVGVLCSRRRDCEGLSAELAQSQEALGALQAAKEEQEAQSREALESGRQEKEALEAQLRDATAIVDEKSRLGPAGGKPALHCCSFPTPLPASLLLLPHSGRKSSQLLRQPLRTAESSS